LSTLWLSGVEEGRNLFCRNRWVIAGNTSIAHPVESTKSIAGSRRAFSLCRGNLVQRWGYAHRAQHMTMVLRAARSIDGPRRRFVRIASAMVNALFCDRRSRDKRLTRRDRIERILSRSTSSAVRSLVAIERNSPEYFRRGNVLTAGREDLRGPGRDPLARIDFRRGRCRRSRCLGVPPGKGISNVLRERSARANSTIPRLSETEDRCSIIACGCSGRVRCPAAHLQMKLVEFTCRDGAAS